MNARSIAVRLAEFGAALFVFAVILWAGSRPDFYRAGTAACASLGSPGYNHYDACHEEAMRAGDTADALYLECLFTSSRDDLCESVPAVPYLSITGLLILLTSGGLLLINRKSQAA